MSVGSESIPEQKAVVPSWKKYFWRKNLAVIPSGILLLLFVVTALFPGLFANHDPNLTDLSIRLKPIGFVDASNSVYLLGTDGLGRDIFSRIIYGARVSLTVSVVAVLISGIIGGLLGVIAGYYTNAISSLIMRIADILLSIPFLLLAIITVAVLGPNLLNLIIVLGVARWPIYARVAQGKALATVNQDFVKASAALGAGSARLIRRHIIPEVLPSLIVVATIEVGLMIVFEASLSFIGLGVQPPTASWGSMLQEGQQYIVKAWGLATFPGLCIFLVVISVNLLGDYVRDKLDPKSRIR